MSRSFARRVPLADWIAMGRGATINVVVGSPASPNAPASTVNVMRPAVVPVEKTALAWLLSSTAVLPWPTVKESTRLLVATNCTALSLGTAVTVGANARLTKPDAATGDGCGRRMVRVCCSLLATVGVSKLRIGVEREVLKPVPVSVYVRVATVSVPAAGPVSKAVNVMGNETLWLGLMATLEGATMLNAAPEPAIGEMVRLCGFGLKMDNVQFTMPPTSTRP